MNSERGASTTSASSTMTASLVVPGGNLYAVI